MSDIFVYNGLCRICLHEEGVVPLFDELDSNVSTKLLSCIHEKVPIISLCLSYKLNMIVEIFNFKNNINLLK